MKSLGIHLCLITILATFANAAELLWANFDADPVGSVANLPGWSRATHLNTQTAQVSSAGSYSDSHCLELPWHASGSSAAYTNFKSVYNSTSEHPVIRCSAKLYIPNTNMAFQVGLRNSTSGALLTFEGTNGYGTFGTETHDAVFVPLVNDRFVDVTMSYNRSNNYYRLDYDNTNRLAWSTNNAAPPLVHTQFNQFVVTRLNSTAGTSGSFLIDNVRVETFPPHVWAWWRCTSVSGTEFNEQLGTFSPTYRFFTTDNHRPGSADPVWDGQGDFHNEGATRELAEEPAACVSATPSSSNWTAEAVFQIAPGEQNVAFLDWGKGNGYGTNGAWFGFGYNAAYTSFYFNCRDAEQANGDYMWSSTLAPFAPDGRWHHAALVKSNATLLLYLDYQPATNIPLSGLADGTYAFDTQSRAGIGQTLGNGNMSGTQTLIDEVRVSGKDLALSEFLQPGQPMIVAINGNALNNDPWPLTVKGILGKSYRAESRPALGTATNWQTVPGGGFTANHTFNYVDIPSTAKTNFVRIIREN